MSESERQRKIRIAGIKRHGSEANWRKYLRETAALSSRNSAGTPYFAKLAKENPGELKKISKAGVKARAKNG